MPYYDETTGLWYDEEGNVVPAPTEGGTQRGAGTYGASGAPTTVDPGTGDITWNIPAPGRTERFQGDIQDLGYQLAISGASLEQAEQQLGERFDAGEYFRQINLYRNTVWAMEHGDRYLGGRQLPGALADVPAFTEALQQQPRGAEGLQAALQDQPTPTDQQQQITPDQQAATVPFNPQAEANRLEYNRRLAARPDLQTQGFRPIPENYDISQQGFMQPAPTDTGLGVPDQLGAPTELPEWYPFGQWAPWEVGPPGAGVTAAGLPTQTEIDAEMGRVVASGAVDMYWPRSNNQIAAARRIALQNLGVTEQQLATGGVAEDEDWEIDPEQIPELFGLLDDPLAMFYFTEGIETPYQEELWALRQAAQGMTEDEWGEFASAVGGEAGGIDWGMEGLRARADNIPIEIFEPYLLSQPNMTFEDFDAAVSAYNYGTPGGAGYDYNIQRVQDDEGQWYAWDPRAEIGTGFTIIETPPSFMIDEAANTVKDEDFTYDFDWYTDLYVHPEDHGLTVPGSGGEDQLGIPLPDKNLLDILSTEGERAALIRSLWLKEHPEAAAQAPSETVGGEAPRQYGVGMVQIPGDLSGMGIYHAMQHEGQSAFTVPQRGEWHRVSTNMYAAMLNRMKPALEQLGVANIEHIGGYQVEGKGPNSWHRTGDALDVTAFQMNDGRVLWVTDYNAGRMPTEDVATMDSILESLQGSFDHVIHVGDPSYPHWEVGMTPGQSVSAGGEASNEERVASEGVMQRMASVAIEKGWTEAQIRADLVGFDEATIEHILLLWRQAKLPQPIL